MPPAWFAALLAAEIAASLYKVNIALPGGDATLTLGVAVGVAALLHIGTAPTVLIVALGIWVQCATRPARPWTCAAACSAWPAGR